MSKVVEYYFYYWSHVSYCLAVHDKDRSGSGEPNLFKF